MFVWIFCFEGEGGEAIIHPHGRLRDVYVFFLFFHTGGEVWVGWGGGEGEKKQNYGHPSR